MISGKKCFVIQTQRKLNRGEVLKVCGAFYSIEVIFFLFFEGPIFHNDNNLDFNIWAYGKFFICEFNFKKAARFGNAWVSLIYVSQAIQILS